MIPEEHKEEFERFMEGGEVSVRFLTWFESCEEAKKEADRILRNDSDMRDIVDKYLDRPQ